MMFGNIWTITDYSCYIWQFWWTFNQHMVYTYVLLPVLFHVIYSQFNLVTWQL